MKKYLKDFEYGNQDVSGGIQEFWAGSSLRVSADEQVRFLARLYRGELPVDRRVSEVVRRLLVLDTNGTAVLSGKSGNGIHENGVRVAWFIGHLRTRDGAEYVFATNIQGTDVWGREARKITEAVLQEHDLWESGDSRHDPARALTRF